MQLIIQNMLIYSLDINVCFFRNPDRFWQWVIAPKKAFSVCSKLICKIYAWLLSARNNVAMENIKKLTMMMLHVIKNYGENEQR